VDDAADVMVLSDLIHLLGVPQVQCDPVEPVAEAFKIIVY